MQEQLLGNKVDREDLRDVTRSVVSMKIVTCTTPLIIVDEQMWMNVSNHICVKQKSRVGEYLRLNLTELPTRKLVNHQW